jgi:hypothetical protein
VQNPPDNRLQSIIGAWPDLPAEVRRVIAELAGIDGKEA